MFEKEVRIITTEGQWHLGTVTGSQEYKDQWCSGKAQGWRENIELLAEIVKSHTHAAYVAFTKGYKSKFPYFMRTIDSFEDQLCGTNWGSDQWYFPPGSFSPMQARDNGASSWLNALTLEERGLTLNRQQFRDSLRLHYNLLLADLPSHCACGDRFTVSHALSSKKTVLLHKDMMASTTFSHLCSAKSARMSR